MRLDEAKKLREELTKFDAFSDCVKRIDSIIRKVENNTLELALVGEFSSGKTSLLNALFDLSFPVDIKPETSSVWKIYLKNSEEGQKRTEIKVKLENGKERTVLSPQDVKKISPEEISYIEVNVYRKDTKNVVIVDTPGLSSGREKDKKILEEFLKKADAIFVVIDGNQGTVTNSARRFLMEKSQAAEIYAVISKADLKPPGAISAIKRQIQKDLFGMIKKVVVASARKKQLSEVLKVLDEIDRRRKEILEMSVEKKLNLICRSCLVLAEEQLKNANLDLGNLPKREKEYEEKLRKFNQDLKLKEREIEKEVKKIFSKAGNIFEENMRQRIDEIASSISGGSNALKMKFNSELRNSLEEMQKYISSRLSRYASNMSVLLNTSFPITSGINDWPLYMADFVEKFKQNIAAKLLTMVFGVEFLALEEALSQLISMFARAKIKQEVEKAAIEAAEKVEESLRELSDEVYQDLVKTFKSEMEKTINNLRRGLEEIREMKKGKETEFENYITNLKELIATLETCSGEV